MWPESEKRNARADLRAVLHKLRKTLREESAHDGVARFFVIESNRLELEPREIELDLEVFEAAVSLARRETSLEGSSAADGGRRELIGRLQGVWDSTGVSSWRASRPKMPPSSSCGSRVSARGGGGVFGELCERLSRLEGEEGLIAEAIGTARLWVRQAPLEETAHRRLMELLSGAGESERALLVYEVFEHPKQSLGWSPLRSMQLSARCRRRSKRGLLWCEPNTLCSYYCAFGWRCRWLGRRVWCARLRVSRAAQANARRVHPGEAGIGKTRLAEEFLLWARARRRTS